MRKTAFVLALLVAAGCSSDPGLQDISKLEGRWRVLRLEGADEAVEEGKEIFEIKKKDNGHVAETTFNGEQLHCDVRLDTSKKPANVQLVKDGNVVGRFTVTFNPDGRMVWQSTDGAFKATMERDK